MCFLDCRKYKTAKHGAGYVKDPSSGIQYPLLNPTRHSSHSRSRSRTRHSICIHDPSYVAINNPGISFTYDYEDNHFKHDNPTPIQYEQLHQTSSPLRMIPAAQGQTHSIGRRAQGGHGQTLGVGVGGGIYNSIYPPHGFIQTPIQTHHMAMSPINYDYSKDDNDDKVRVLANDLSNLKSRVSSREHAEEIKAAEAKGRSAALKEVEEKKKEAVKEKRKAKREERDKAFVKALSGGYGYGGGKWGGDGGSGGTDPNHDHDRRGNRGSRGRNHYFHHVDVNWNSSPPFGGERDRENPVVRQVEDVLEGLKEHDWEGKMMGRKYEKYVFGFDGYVGSVGNGENGKGGKYGFDGYGGGGKGGYGNRGRLNEAWIHTQSNLS